MDNQEIALLPIFNTFNEPQIQQIKPLMVFCSFPADMVLFEQGDRADNFYILIAGEVALHFKPYDGPSLVMSKITSGGIFGWSAALNREKYSAAAITTSETRAIKMKASDLKKLCAKDPVVGTLFLDRLVGVISEKLQVSHQDFLNLFSNRINVGRDCKRRIKLNGSENRFYAGRTDARIDRTT
ncbi:MAG TPA: cyclic nucleotide-binding domain-containing protein [Anaerolineaceae bacterium]|nr:cyclic nucleotide-binding domain-containing protein [Anaerolineaceae bacterium]